MSYNSAQAKGNIVDAHLRVKFRKAMNAAKIDRTETSFGGKGSLTKQQFSQGMGLAVKMYNKTSW